VSARSRGRLERVGDAVYVDAYEHDDEAWDVYVVARDASLALERVFEAVDRERHELDRLLKHRTTAR
jgi:hypothetical protein